MTVDPDVRRLMNQQVTIAHATGQDKHGVEIFGAGTAYYCRILNKNTLVRDAEGLEVMSQALVILEAVASTTVRDRITLPDGTTPKILAVDQVADETSSGDLYEKIYLKG